MFSLRKPSPHQVDEFLAAHIHDQFSYASVGASRDNPPNAYTVDHNRVRLGEGPEVFDRAVKAIRQWKMFDVDWLQLCWPETPIQVGATVAVLASHFGFWSLNACRIVYVIEKEAETFGFAYGTLADHAERGEERFTVEFHAEDGSVWYDIYAFSRPNPLTSLGYPLARILQKRFARDSKSAMSRAVQQT